VLYLLYLHTNFKKKSSLVVKNEKCENNNGMRLEVLFGG